QKGAYSRMVKDFDFNGLFTYDMANNHQGSLEHGLRIVDEISRVSNEFAVRGAIKFQFRQIPTFIHPAFKDKQNIPHIPRFVETSLSHGDYQAMANRIREHGLITMCTPFDEESVDVILNMGIEIIKVASCSATDWPLISRIAQADKPVIISTAGLTLNEIDRLVSYLEINRVHFALMHCVAIYPTPVEKLQLNQIELLKKRYPLHAIGYSTHEPPDYLDGIKMAFAKGAAVFERHVGVESESIKLNAYSSTPAQIANWLKAYRETVEACGSARRAPASPKEIDSLCSLKRGVYARKDLQEGDRLEPDKVFFAMPLQAGQLESGEWKSFFEADKTYAAEESISETVLTRERTQEDLLHQILLQVKGMMNEARIALGKEDQIELSHHYGLDRFREFGAVIIDCINRSYCKKLILQLPRQKHPYHYHAKKEETFLVLHGDVDIEVDGNRRTFHPGDSLVVHPDEWHKFQTSNGVIIEEISTTHYNDDSFYEDKLIAKLPRQKRKTSIDNWRNTGQLK
ncbi:MAG: N-acetylneuraminate synthase family protein, partial [Deltaproteobacteria bacterium]|nr:N-acetylneuraminate synthase family protein [Deltaproteobacteria bacterium]